MIHRINGLIFSQLKAGHAATNTVEGRGGNLHFAVFNLQKNGNDLPRGLEVVFDRMYSVHVQSVTILLAQTCEKLNMVLIDKMSRFVLIK